MARWELREPHYLYTEPGTKWEYIETDRTTGRQVRKQFDVPQYFHHEAETDWTEFTTLANGQRSTGKVVVCNGHNPGPRDIIFKGDPTPGMQPIDDEAREITAKLKTKWNLPDKMFDMNNVGDYATNLADHFVQMQDKVNMQVQKMAEQRTEGMDKFMQTMAEMMAQNQQILAALVGKATQPAAAKIEKRQSRPIDEGRLEKLRANLAKARAARMVRMAKKVEAPVG